MPIWQRVQDAHSSLALVNLDLLILARRVLATGTSTLRML